MAKERQPIRGLTDGWFWVDQGKEEWTNSKGKKSTARHAINIYSGKTYSVRQVQNIQKTGEGKSTKTKPVQKTGITKTTTKKDRIIYRFRSLYDLFSFIVDGGIPDNFDVAMLQLKFKRSKIPGKVYKRKKIVRRKNKKGEIVEKYTEVTVNYASLTGWEFVDDLMTDTKIWNTVMKELEEFELDDNSRFYVFAARRGTHR